MQDEENKMTFRILSGSERDRLQEDIDAAVRQIESGDFVEYDSESLRGLFEELKQSARLAGKD